MRLTGKEVGLAVSFAVMGFIFSMRELILWLDTLNPLEGLIFYYIILYGALFALSKMGLVVFGFKIKSLTQTAGLILITFAFFILVGWTSPYIQYVTGRSVEGASVIFYQCEDGSVFWGWMNLLPWAGIEVWRLLTFVFTPFVLVLCGALLVEGHIKLGA